MSSVCMFLADGFEEVEAVTITDYLRRAGVKVEIVSVTGEYKARGAHNIVIKTDSVIEEGSFFGCDMMFLPGGMPGMKNLYENARLRDAIQTFVKENKYLTAICAAPSVYGLLGLLKGKRATCYPGLEGNLKGAVIVDDNVVTDGLFITSKGPGTATEMALEMIKILEGKGRADEVAKGILYNV